MIFLTTQSVLDALTASWPPVVARADIARLTGGLVAPKSLANADSMKCGPGGKVLLGKRVGYMKPNLIAWLTARLTIPDTAPPLEASSIDAPAAKPRRGRPRKVPPQG